MVSLVLYLLTSFSSNFLSPFHIPACKYIFLLFSSLSLFSFLPVILFRYFRILSYSLLFLPFSLPQLECVCLTSLPPSSLSHALVLTQSPFRFSSLHFPSLLIFLHCFFSCFKISSCFGLFIDPFNNDIICRKALWKQSLFVTYLRYTTHF